MPQPPHPPRLGPIQRGLFFGLGLFFTACGFVGAFLPVMPTVPFLIVAAACFTRSSPRLEAWLLAHPRFGPLLIQWREKRAIPRRAKYFALAGCIFGFSTMQILGFQSPYLTLPVMAVMLASIAFVFSRPDS